MSSASLTQRLDPNRTATASVATLSSVHAAIVPFHARERMPPPLATARLTSPAPASVDPAGADETSRAARWPPPPPCVAMPFLQKSRSAFRVSELFLSARRESTSPYCAAQP